jgi:hypothetical protein
MGGKFKFSAQESDMGPKSKYLLRLSHRAAPEVPDLIQTSEKLRKAA